jgi:hypothetical protein
MISLVVQVEQLTNSALHFIQVKRLCVHLGLVCRPLIVLASVYSLLAWLHSLADKAPDHDGAIHAVPRQQHHQHPHLAGEL